MARYRYRINIQKRTRVFDGEGWKYDWQTIDTVWGHISPVSAQERLEWQKLDVEVTHKISLRPYPGIDRIDHRLEFKGRIFTIVSMLNPQEMGRRLDLICTEEG